MVNSNADALENATVYDREEKKVGTVRQVYLDDQTQKPKFVTVNTGLFGTKETFVPLDSASRVSNGLAVPFAKDFIQNAPSIDAEGHLTPEE